MCSLRNGQDKLMQDDLTGDLAHSCCYLLQAAPYVGTPETPLIKDLIKKLNATSFQAQHALLAAIASCDPNDGSPLGLMKARERAGTPLAFHTICHSYLMTPLRYHA